MTWRDHVPYDGHRIIQHGFSHHQFVKIARDGLWGGIEAQLARRLPAHEMTAFRNQVRSFRMHAKLGHHPFDEMISQIDAWITSALNQADDRVLNHRIRTAADWLDDQLDGIVNGALRHYSHHFR